MPWSKEAIDAAPSLVVLSNDTPKFAIGAKIRLISGGPDMTVSNGSPTMVEAVWFEGKCLHRAAFRNQMVAQAKGDKNATR